MPENEATKTTAEDVTHAATGEGTNQADQFWGFISGRTAAMQLAGMPAGRAQSTAMLEYRIAQWPPEWGNELRIIIYGDFRPPKTDRHFRDLGIVVEAGAVKGSVVRSAMCVVKARVTVSTKSVVGLMDAIARINTLLGVLAALHWGDANGWWCLVTHGSMGGVSPEFEQDGFEGAIKAVEHLQPEVKCKGLLALFGAPHGSQREQIQ
jgi:hypothetical protein